MIDKTIFANGMGQLAGAFNKNLDAAVSRMYYGILSNSLTTEQFAESVTRALATETFWPSPAALIAKVRQETSDDVGALALHHVNATMGRYGGFRYLPFAEFDKFDAATKAAINAVGGLSEIANTPVERYAGLTKRFVKAHAFALNPPKSLPSSTIDPKVRQLVAQTTRDIMSGRDRAAGDT